MYYGHLIDVDLGVLLKMLDGLSKRPDGKISCQAFQGVLEGFSCQEALKGEEINKVPSSLSILKIGHDAKLSVEM